MFVVLLKFAENKSAAGAHMAGHKAWLERGFADGVFVLSGGLQPSLGGAVLAYNISRAELLARVNEDPFVAEGVVDAEILDIAPARADERLSFLLGAQEGAA